LSDNTLVHEAKLDAMEKWFFSCLTACVTPPYAMWCKLGVAYYVTSKKLENELEDIKIF